MAKLIKILAASVGGGIMLAAGIRLGEAIITGGDRPLRQDRDKETDGKLAARLGALENRLRSLEGESPASHLENQAVEVASIRSQLNMGERELEGLREVGLRLRGELQGWIEERVGARMADVESKLRTESERGQRQMLDAFVESVQTRVTHRISRLEEEVAGQSAAMTELRECSMRTEQSMQKLLGGLDRLIVAQPPPVADTRAGAPTHEEPPARNASPEGDAKADSGTAPPVDPVSPEEPRPKSRRWSIFG